MRHHPDDLTARPLHRRARPPRPLLRGRHRRPRRREARKVPGLIEKLRAEARSASTAVREHRPQGRPGPGDEAGQGGAETVQAKVTEVIGSLDTDLKKLARDRRRTSRCGASGVAAEYAVKARETYEKVAERGEQAVQTWRGETAEEIAEIAVAVEPEPEREARAPGAEPASPQQPKAEQARTAGPKKPAPARKPAPPRSRQRSRARDRRHRRRPRGPGTRGAPGPRRYRWPGRSRVHVGCRRGYGDGRDEVRPIDSRISGGGQRVGAGVRRSLLWLLYSGHAPVQRCSRSVDAAVRREDAYRAADKQTKMFWLIILGLAVAVNLLLRCCFLQIVGLIATIVYIVDVRPALKQVTGGGRRPGGSSSDGPYGPFNGGADHPRQSHPPSPAHGRRPRPFGIGRHRTAVSAPVPRRIASAELPAARASALPGRAAAPPRRR